MARGAERRRRIAEAGGQTGRSTFVMSLGIFGPIVSRAADILFSEKCCMCGDSLIEPNVYPLCTSCRLAFKPRSGSLCDVCSMELLSEQHTCLRCRDRSFAFTSNYSLFLYDQSTRDVLSQYKGRNTISLAVFFCEHMAPVIAREHAGKTVVPVPFRRRRKKQRGWDQVEEICRQLKRRYAIEYLPILYRNGSSPQKNLGYQARLSNLDGRIGVRRKALPLPQRVVLLDDVFTTGATADTCASVLKAGGTEEVSVLTIAID